MFRKPLALCIVLLMCISALSLAHARDGINPGTPRTPGDAEIRDPRDPR